MTESAFEMNPSNPMFSGSASKVEIFIFKLYICIFFFAPKVRINRAAK